LIPEALYALDVLASSTTSSLAYQSSAAAALSPLYNLFSTATAPQVPAELAASTYETIERLGVLPKLLSLGKTSLQQLLQQQLVLQAPAAQVALLGSACDTLGAACMVADIAAAGEPSEEQRLQQHVTGSGNRKRASTPPTDSRSN
jgi:hypothetical protein